MAFKDNFSDVAGAYRDFRPRYPRALFAALAALAPGRALAWDCGCGSGQASTGLAEFFDRVAATDASAQQIAEAPSHPRIAFAVAPAERSGLPTGAADLILVAQAIHWFDRPAFYAEARRVGRAGGLLAVVGYGLFGVDEGLDPILHRLHRVTLAPYWPPERALVDEGYRGIAFPFPELPGPALAIEADWCLEQLLGYVSTWSAVQRCRRDTGRDPLAELAPALAARWPAGLRRVRWPLHLRLGRL